MRVFVYAHACVCKHVCKYVQLSTCVFECAGVRACWRACVCACLRAHMREYFTFWTSIFLYAFSIVKNRKPARALAPWDTLLHTSWHFVGAREIA